MERRPSSRGLGPERSLWRRTHEKTLPSAMRAVDRSLVVLNWLFGW